MILDPILDLIFPPRCVNCLLILQKRAGLCTECRAQINIHATFFCGSCRARLPSPRSHCHPSFPYILGAASDYAGPVKQLVHSLKFALVRDAAPELAACLIRYAEKVMPAYENFIVVPVPLSPRRERERGFNQATLIAAPFAVHFKMILEPKALRRIRNTTPQSKTGSLAERSKNVADCFAGNSALVSGKNIFLVDDVATSGATLLEASRALKTAGAKKIVALVAAKA